jgi:polygalacturonase
MLCPTKFYQKDVIVADIIATDAPYLADPTGKIDSTAAIQSALDACRKLGGGVVYLPAGLYLVT